MAVGTIAGSGITDAALATFGHASPSPMSSARPAGHTGMTTYDREAS